MRKPPGTTAATLVALLGMLAGLLVSASAASAAVTWTPLASGTTQQIASVDYKGNTIAYATGSGQIFTGPAGGPFTKMVDAPGTFFTSIALNPSGTRGTAVGRGDDNGELYVYDGNTWAKPDLSTSSVASLGHYQNCANPPVPRGAGPVENVEFTGIAWASDTVGYAVGQRKSGALSDHLQYALKTVDGGATWTDMQNRPDGSCITKEPLWSVHTTPGLVWMAGSHPNGSQLFMSNNGLTSAVQVGSTRRPILAIDPNNTQRQMAATDGGPGYASWSYTDNLWNSYDWGGRKSGHDDTKTIRSLKATANGWFYIAGDGGLIERTKNMTDAEALPAGGALALQNWRSIAFADNSRAVVAGDGGALAVTSSADQPVTDPAPGVPGTPGQPGAGNRPAVSSPSISNRTLRPGQSTTIGFNVAAAGRAILTVEKKIKGVKLKRRVKTKAGRRQVRQVCVVRSRKNLRQLRRQAGSKRAYRKLLRRKTCRTFTRVGKINKRVVPGRNAIKLNGRVAGRKLGPGVYRAKLIVTNAAGKRSRAEVFRFRVVRKK